MAERGFDEFNEMSEIYSFIVEIWLDKMETPSARLRWHGHITDVRDGKRHYIKNLKEIPDFIQAHLVSDGES